MVMSIYNVDHYLHQNKRDILILRMGVKKSSDIFIIDRELCETAAQEQIEWFQNRGVDVHKTCAPEVLAGWDGLYYIDIDPRNNLLVEYSQKFENSDGVSLRPEEYQMLMVSYDAWVKSGKLTDYEQHLKNLEDPDWMPDY